MLSWMCMLFGTGFLAQKLRGCGLLSTPIFFCGVVQNHIYTLYMAVYFVIPAKNIVHTPRIYIYILI
jgi:hypothetical protein